MIRIGITGKANSGKDTVINLLIDKLKLRDNLRLFDFECLAFADPLKRMAQLAFPEIPTEWLYGSSKFRNNIIPKAFKNGEPLTVRQLLIDLGNDFGRKYQSDIWIRNLEYNYRKVLHSDVRVVLVSDCRFKNEFEYLKQQAFFQVRILRNDSAKIDDISETDQDGISNEEFDHVIYNNATLSDLESEVSKIVLKIK